MAILQHHATIEARCFNTQLDGALESGIVTVDAHLAAAMAGDWPSTANTADAVTRTSRDGLRRSIRTT